MGRAAGDDSKARARLRIAFEGAKDREVGGTNPTGLMLPGVNWPQPLPQDRLETSGPAGGWALVFRQQQCARLRQQEDWDALKEPAARGAREANERNSARHAATVLRAK